MTPEEVAAAAERIAGRVRRTPLVRVEQVRETLPAAELWLKLECLQVTGSFKARGATNRLLSLPPERLQRGIVTASGGNHGLATARAAYMAGVPAIIYLPETASPSKVAKLRQWNADIRIVGRVWDDANTVAMAEAEALGACYFHPFADPVVVAGQGTVALEILDQMGEADLYLVAIGGGGLIAGMAAVLRARNPKARIVGVEPTGSPTLHASLAAGRVVSLPSVTTRVATMSCGRTDDAVYEAIARTVDEVVLVEDEDLERAARWLWFELGIAADLSGAASVAALLAGAVEVRPGERVCGLVCGAGPEGLMAA